MPIKLLAAYWIDVITAIFPSNGNPAEHQPNPATRTARQASTACLMNLTNADLITQLFRLFILHSNYSVSSLLHIQGYLGTICFLSICTCLNEILNLDEHVNDPSFCVKKIWVYLSKQSSVSWEYCPDRTDISSSKVVMIDYEVEEFYLLLIRFDQLAKVHFLDSGFTGWVWQWTTLSDNFNSTKRNSFAGWSCKGLRYCIWGYDK